MSFTNSYYRLSYFSSRFHRFASLNDITTTTFVRQVTKIYNDIFNCVLHITLRTFVLVMYFLQERVTCIGACSIKTFLTGSYLVECVTDNLWLVLLEYVSRDPSLGGMVASWSLWSTCFIFDFWDNHTIMFLYLYMWLLLLRLLWWQMFELLLFLVFYKMFANFEVMCNLKPLEEFFILLIILLNLLLLLFFFWQ